MNDVFSAMDVLSTMSDVSLKSKWKRKGKTEFVRYIEQKVQHYGVVILTQNSHTVWWEAAPLAAHIWTLGWRSQHVCTFDSHFPRTHVSVHFHMSLNVHSVQLVWDNWLEIRLRLHTCLTPPIHRCRLCTQSSLYMADSVLMCDKSYRIMKGTKARSWEMSCHCFSISLPPPLSLSLCLNVSRRTSSRSVL